MLSVAIGAVALLGAPPPDGSAAPTSTVANPPPRERSTAADQEPGIPAPIVVDYERSTLVAKVKKGGLLRFLGHEHGVIPETWSAEVRFHLEDLQRSGFAVEISSADLIIDTERARRLAAVDPDGPSESEIAEIRAKMLSDEQLDAAAFPVIRFESRALRLRSDSELRIEGTLTLHGVARRVDVVAELVPDGSGYAIRGSFEIKQSDFGVEPVSIGGVVKVADEVEIRFEVFTSGR